MLKDRNIIHFLLPPRSRATPLPIQADNGHPAERSHNLNTSLYSISNLVVPPHNSRWGETVAVTKFVENNVSISPQSQNLKRFVTN